MKTNLHNWEVAELVYTIRLLADNLDKKEQKTDSELEMLSIAYEALRIPGREIHELANILEANDNYE